MASALETISHTPLTCTPLALPVVALYVSDSASLAIHSSQREEAVDDAAVNNQSAYRDRLARLQTPASDALRARILAMIAERR